MSDDTFDVDEFLAEAAPRTAKAKVCPRGDLLDEHQRLDLALGAEVEADSKRNKGKKAPALARKVEALQAEIEASIRTFTFESIGRRAWVELREKHPPTEEQARQGRDHNPLTFPDAAIAASSASPQLTRAQVQALAEKLNDSEYDKLWVATLTANLGVVVDAPKSVLASAVLHLSKGGGSPISPPEESPSPSDSDDIDDQPLNTSTTTTDG